MTTQAHLTAAESEALKSIAAAEAAGRDPFGDDDTDETTDDATPAQAATTTEAEAGEEQATTTEQQEAAAPATEPTTEAVAEQPAAPVQTAYQAELPADLATKRAALMTEKAEALEKLMAGEVDAKEYAAIEVRVTGELETLSRAQATSEVLLTINQQNAAQESQRVIGQIIANTKPVLDYSKDATAQRQFDTAMQMLAADPANAAKPYAELAGEANRTVLALRGLKLPGKTEAKETPKQTEREVPETPVTLRQVPAAATANAGGGVAEKLANLKGQQFEDAYAKLTPAQQAALLDE
jgi:hypothetical protein